MSDARASSVESVTLLVPQASGVAAATGAAPSVEEAPTPQADERRIFALANEERARAHLPLLVWDEALARVARAHSAEMRDRDHLDHRSKATGASPIQRAQRAGLRPSMLLENIGYAYDAEQANFAFMYSAGHRNNILHPDVRKLGVGVMVRIDKDGDRQLWVTQDFARDLPLLNSETTARARARVLATYRGRHHLVEESWLTEVAQAAAELRATGHSLEGLPLAGGHDPTGSTKMHYSLQVITVRTADPDHLGTLPGAVGETSSYGIGVALEPDDGRLVRNACVVLVLGH